MKKKTSVLGMRMIASVMVLGIVICLVTGYEGYKVYNDTIQNTYNEKAYEVADLVSLCFTDEEMEGYITAAENIRNGDTSFTELSAIDGAEEAYTGSVAELRTLLSEFGAAEIYIYCVDDSILSQYQKTGDEELMPFTCIFDICSDESNERVFGETSGVNAEFADVIIEAVSSTEKVSNYLVSESEIYSDDGKEETGYNTTAITTKMVNGKYYSVGVVEPMTSIVDNIREYVVNNALATIGLIIMFSVAYIIFINRKLVGPINAIAKETEDFVNLGGTPEDSLSGIKNTDEIGELAKDVKAMEAKIISGIRKYFEVEKEKERIGSELDIAKGIQGSMLPSIFPPFPERTEFDIYASMNPAKEVGGDFYDYFMIDDDHLCMVIADVSGKGVPAALFMVITKVLIKDCAMNDLSPKSILESVNKKVYENNETDMFVTAWLGIYEISTGKLKAANAGHEYPMLRKPGGKFEIIKDKHGFVLGGLDNARYREYEVEIEHGSTLFVYTDGVTEATNSSDELFGLDRILDALNENPGTDPYIIIENVGEAISRFVDGAEQSDDITMLCMKAFDENSANKINVRADVSNLNAVTDFIDARLEREEASAKVIAQINIATDEIFSNVANYAYEGGEGDITVLITVDNGIAAVAFTDTGVEYNPLLHEDPDITLSADEREIGGLGIFMVKKTMDSLDYKYSGGRNILTITKKIR